MKNHEGICWLCNEKTLLTNEHRFKLSQLKKQYREKSFKDLDPIEKPYLLRDNKKLILQGVKDTLLTFENSLCAKCNNEKTQKQDTEFDFLIQKIKSGVNDDQIDQLNLTPNLSLYGYYFKIMGCYMHDINIPIPDEFRELILNGKISHQMHIHHTFIHYLKIFGIPYNSSIYINESCAYLLLIRGGLLVDIMWNISEQERRKLQEDALYGFVNMATSIKL